MCIHLVYLTTYMYIRAIASCKACPHLLSVYLLILYLLLSINYICLLMYHLTCLSIFLYLPLSICLYNVYTPCLSDYLHVCTTSYLVCLSVCLSAYAPPPHLSIYLLIPPPVYLPMCIHHLTCLSIFLFLPLSICLCVCTTSPIYRGVRVRDSG